MLSRFLRFTIIFSIILSCYKINAQSENTIRYYIKTTSESVAPVFEKEGNYAEYSGTDSKEQDFFSKYTITDFRQVYPSSNRANLRNAFILTTTSTEIASDLLITFPEKYASVDVMEEESYVLNSSPYYPSDYTTSTVRIPFNTNVYDRNDLEYIDAPKAWGITDTISNAITIGISDAKVDDQSPELSGKVTYYNAYGATTTVDCNDIYTTHGTNTSVIAAAKKNNGGTVGVCYDCDILATSYGNYDNLLRLAQDGAKVINISWGNSLPVSLTPDQYRASSTKYQDEQNCINEIVEDYGVILVASSGNETSFDSNGPNLLYNYPASYDNVISVAGVNHWYSLENYPSGEHVFPSTPNNQYYIRFIENSLARYVDTIPSQPVGVYSQYWDPDNTYMQTLNEEVDICAPGYQIPLYKYSYYSCATDSDPIYGGKYSSGTSMAAPIVTGTIGLMLTVNECLEVSDVESILKLTAKDIEVNPLNYFAEGYIGAGKLETGNAVEFVHEMQKSDGVATIKDHIFYRYDFNLDNFNNDLVIENVTFKEDATVDFTVKNSIRLTEGTHLVPNANGYISLRIDTMIDNTCTNSSRQSTINNEPFVYKTEVEESKLYVFPNPANQKLSLNLLNSNDFLSQIEIYNLQGNLLLTKEIDKSVNVISIDVSNLQTGIYLCRVITEKNNTYNRKIIKQ